MSFGKATENGTLALVVSLAMALAVTSADAGESQIAAPAPVVDPHATGIVQRMAERLATAERFSVGGEIAWDVVQADGQTLEFGAARELVLQRPDHLLVDLDLHEGGKRRLLFDGKEVVFQDLQDDVYAIHPFTGSVDDMAAFAADRLGIPVALSELLSPDLPQQLGAHLRSASYVGESTIDGVVCDHVAVRNEIGGMQLWIGRDDSLPRRITITYEHEPGRPQFRARLTGWNLSPQITAATFAFVPPKGAEKIAFAVRSETTGKGGSK